MPPIVGEVKVVVGIPGVPGVPVGADPPAAYAGGMIASFNAQVTVKSNPC